MECKGCWYENTDCILCAKAKLADAWNDLLKEMPILRVLAKETYECPYFEKKEER